MILTPSKKGSKTDLLYFEGVCIHISCHSRAQNMGQKGAEMLRLIPDTDVDVIERCSGHGGSWGVMEDNFEVALKIGKPVARKVAEKGAAHIVSECPLARNHILQGIETLSLRMQRHIENTKAVVEFLAEQEEVEWLNHPMLPDHPDHDLAQSLLPKGCGAVFSFGIKGGRDAGIKFIENLELFSHLANVGDAKSLVIHPASTTHSQLNDKELAASGVTQSYVRLCIGIEHIDDIIDDLNQALNKSSKGSLKAVS